METALRKRSEWSVIGGVQGPIQRSSANTAGFPRFQPNQGSLPAGDTVAAMRKVPVPDGKSAFAAAIDAAHSKGGQAPARQLGPVRHEPPALIRHEGRLTARIGVQHLLAHLGTHFEVLRSD